MFYKLYWICISGYITVTKIETKLLVSFHWEFYRGWHVTTKWWLAIFPLPPYAGRPRACIRSYNFIVIFIYISIVVLLIE